MKVVVKGAFPNDAAIEKTLEMVDSLIRNRQGVDEYTLFGEQIAIKLRSLKTDYARITVQHHINNLIYEAQMGKYDYSETQNQGHFTTLYSTNQSLQSQSSKESNLPSTSQYAISPDQHLSHWIIMISHLTWNKYTSEYIKNKFKQCFYMVTDSP